MRYVHLVGSIGLASAQDVFATVGKLVGHNIKRCPDPEPGRRRMGISWQYPFLRSSPYLCVVEDQLLPGGVGFCALPGAPLIPAFGMSGTGAPLCIRARLHPCRNQSFDARALASVVVRIAGAEAQLRVRRSRHE